MATEKTTETKASLRFLMFSSKMCSACKAMEKTKALDKFAKAHPEIEIVKVSTDNDEGDKRADEYRVKALPTLVLETPEGIELTRVSNATDLEGLEKMVIKATNKIRVHAQKRATSEAGGAA